MPTTRSLLKMFVMAGWLSLFNFQTCAAQSLTRDAGSLETEILSKELSLFELSTKVAHQNSTKGPWRQRRWFLYTLANQSLTATGALRGGIYRLKFRNNPGSATRSVIVNSNYLRVIANAISLGGCIAEATIDGATAFNRIRTHQDRATYLAQAKATVTQLDSLLKEASSPSGDPDFAATTLANDNLEILLNLRNLAVEDFEEIYARAQGIQASRYFQYAFVGASNATSFGGSLTNTLATQLRLDPRVGITGAVTDMVTGSMNAISPELVSRCQRRVTRNQLDSLHSPITLEQQRQELAALAIQLEEARTVNQTRQDKRMFPILSLENHLASDHLSARPAPPAGTLAEVVGNFGAAVNGSSKVVNGVMGAVGNGLHYNNAPARVRCVGAGNITYGIGSSIGAEETLRNQINAEWRWYRKPRAQHTVGILESQLHNIRNVKALLKNE